jgi:hypothetical protein
MKLAPKVGDGVALLRLGDTCLVLWKAPAITERWEWQFREIKRASDDQPDGVLFLSIITSSSSPPNSELRKRMQEDFRGMGDKLRRAVVLPVGNSIWSSVVRTIVKGSFLISGQSKRQVVAANLHEAIDRLREAAGLHTPSRRELEDAATALCESLGLQPLA